MYKEGDQVVLLEGALFGGVRPFTVKQVIDSGGYFLDNRSVVGDTHIDHEATKALLNKEKARKKCPLLVDELEQIERLLVKAKGNYIIPEDDCYVFEVDFNNPVIQEVLAQQEADKFKSEHSDIANIWLNKNEKGYFTTVKLKDGRKATVRKADEDEHNWREAMWWCYTKALKELFYTTKVYTDTDSIVRRVYL